MRALAAWVVVGMVAVACGGATTDAAPSSTSTTATTGVSSTVEGAASNSEVPQDQPAADPSTDGDPSDASNPPATSSTPAPAPQEAPIDGPAAPDFSLTLASGEPFSLGEEVKPVYMVFWAEW
ncbi:MAG: hypothetical protein ACR2NL_12765 [Acidimicrobiia bacterium]